MKFIKLGSVCKLRNGYAFKSNNFIEIGVPIIRISNINDNVVTPEKAVRTNYEEIFDNYKIVKGDILIAMSGATTGKFGIYNSDEIAYQNQRVGCFKILDNSILNKTYLLQVLNIVKPTIEKKANGGAQPNISANAIEEIIIPLPSIEDQIRIADILTKSETLITQRKESILMLDELLKSIFLEMFGDPIRNEKGWGTLSLKEIVKVGTGGTPSRNRNDYYGGNINWAKTTEVRGSYIVDTDEKITELAIKESNCKVYKEGTILLAMYGQGKTRGNVGFLKIAAATNQACAAIPPTENINQIFLFELLKNSYSYLRSLARGGNQENLNLDIVGKINIILPNTLLQTKFATVVLKIETLRTEYQKSLEELENMYGILSQKAFNGELVKSKENKLDKKKDDTVMEGEPDEIIDIKNYTREKKEKVDITNMTFADYVGFPEEFQIRDEKWMAKFLGQDEFYQFLLKDNFKDVSFNLGDIEMKFHNFFYQYLDMDFEIEPWRSAIFEFMKADPPIIIQRFNEESATIKLELTDEAYKA